MKSDSDVSEGLSLNKDPEDGPVRLSIGKESHIKRKTDELAIQTILTVVILTLIYKKLEFIEKQDDPAQIFCFIFPSYHYPPLLKFKEK